MSSAMSTVPWAIGIWRKANWKRRSGSGNSTSTPITRTRRRAGRTSPLIHSELGNVLIAVEQYRKLLARGERLGTLSTKEGAELRLRYSVLLTSIGDPDGEDLARKGLATREKLLGPTNRDTDIARTVLVAALLDQQKMVEAMALFSSTNLKKLLDNPVEDPVLQAGLQYQRTMMSSFLVSDKTLEGGFKKSVDLFESSLGPDHIFSVVPKFEYAVTLKKNGDTVNAERQFRECMAIVRNTVGLGHPRASKLYDSYCDLLWSQDRKQEAWDIVDEAYAASKEQYPKEFRWRFQITCMHGYYAGKLIKVDDARRDSVDAFDLLAGLKRLMNANEQSYFDKLGRGLGDLSEIALAREHYAKVAGLDRAVQSEQDRKHNMLNYGCILFKKKLYREAVPVLRENLEGYAKSYVYARICLAKCHWRQAEFDEAENNFRVGLKEGKRSEKKSDAEEGIASFVRLLILRRSWADVPALADQYTNAPNQKLIERSWATFIRSTIAELNFVPGTGPVNLARIEKLFGQSTESNTATYRARTVLVSGGDLKREYERLTAINAAEKGVESVRMTLATYEAALGDYLKAIETLKSFNFKTESAVHRKTQLLIAYANERIASNEKTKASLETELAAAEKFLNDSDQFKDPDIGGYAVSQVLELHWWCRKIRNEIAAQKIFEFARRFGSGANHPSGFLLNFW